MLTKLAAAAVAATMMLGPALGAETNPATTPAANPTTQGVQTKAKVSHHQRHRHLTSGTTKHHMLSHKKQHMASRKQLPRSTGHAATQPQTKQPGY